MYTNSIFNIKELLESIGAMIVVLGCLGKKHRSILKGISIYVRGLRKKNCFHQSLFFTWSLIKGVTKHLVQYHLLDIKYDL